MSQGLALHRWFAGQILTPEHFEFQERALLAHIGLRAQIAGLPAHGVASLRLNRPALAEGLVVIEELVLVLSDGRLLGHPGNTTSITPLSVPPGDKCVVFLHVAEPDEPFTGDAAEATAIQPAFFELFLSARRDEPRSSEALPLLELEKTRAGFRLTSFSPALLRIGTTPFLEDALAEIEAGVLRAIERTKRELQERYVRSEALGNLLAFQAASERLVSLLENSAGEGAARQRGVRDAARPHPHPYLVFEALVDYCYALSIAHGRPLPAQRFGYDHDDLGGTFERLRRELLARLHVSAERAPGAAFVREGRLYVLRPLPDDAIEAREVFLALSGGDRSSPPTLASPARLDAVQTNLLPGVPLVPVEPPRFVRAEPGLHFFRVERGSEWRHVVAERAVCFRPRPGEPPSSAELLWTP